MLDPQIQIRGNLVADPTTRVTASGLRMTRFRIASSGRRFDRTRNEFVNNDPVYLSVVCWRQLADNVARSLRKGDTVVVHGRLTMHEYDDTHGGPRRQAYEIDASSVAPDLARYCAELIRPLREIAPADDGAAGGLPGHTQPAQAQSAQTQSAQTGTAENGAAQQDAEPVNPWTEPATLPAETAA